ncbi:iron ABC transporter permease [Candidatus Poribacteria bacterium]|nr:iron ABC transporter permease [Candidatus Poribacteria bacterium]MBT5712273.1 iron ABC transporter permease [Candidatus Poribacteria bacterium]MBT7100885.1 iron ABC transporter permease [Candidatus Poribacteria bacterium]MBT7804578.1 iron ABC transporter permease [Candidatus Poribacteria bacterium]
MWTLWALACLSVVSIAVGCAVGSVSVPFRAQWATLVGALSGGSADVGPGVAHLYLHLRLPRVVLAYLVGVALACVGTLFQALLRNPLAEPYIIGVSPGASLGVTVFVAFAAGGGATAAGGYLWGRTACAFVGGVIAVLTAYMLASRGRFLNMSDILLAGIAIGALGVAITSYLWISVLQEFRGLLYWLMGNFGGSSWSRVGLLVVLVLPCVAVCWRLAPTLNLLSLGEEHAAYLGLNVERFKQSLLALGTLATAATVSVSGVVGFVGIIVPHLVRRLVGADNARVVPASCLMGGAFLVACDLVARTIVAPLELPVGMLTAFVGAPFFLYVMRRSRGSA